MDQLGLISRKICVTIEYCANSNSSVRRLGRVVFEKSFVTNTRTQRLRGEPGCNRVLDASGGFKMFVKWFVFICIIIMNLFYSELVLNLKMGFEEFELGKEFRLLL